MIIPSVEMFKKAKGDIVLSMNICNLAKQTVDSEKPKTSINKKIMSLLKGDIIF